MCIQITSMHVIARRLFTRKLMTESLRFSHRNFQQHTNINKLDHRLLDCQGTWLQLVARNYASKNNIFAYSGDLTMQKPLEPHAVLYNAKGLTGSLQQASESVQRLSTVGYADGRERKTHYVEDIQDRIEDLFGVGADLELRIAKLTVDIRTVIPHCVKFSQDKKNKAQLVEKIQMRKKLLKYLRKEDYQRFLWLLRELRIRYVPIQEYHGHASKKFLKRSGTVKAAFDVRKQKLIELREQLDAELADYEVYKQKTLADIQNDIEKLCLDRNLLWKQQVRESVTKAEVKLLKKARIKEMAKKQRHTPAIIMDDLEILAYNQADPGEHGVLTGCSDPITPQPVTPEPRCFTVETVSGPETFGPKGFESLFGQ